jgi:hypothetical protein
MPMEAHVGIGEIATIVVRVAIAAVAAVEAVIAIVIGAVTSIDVSARRSVVVRAMPAARARAVGAMEIAVTLTAVTLTVVMPTAAMPTGPRPAGQMPTGRETLAGPRRQLIVRSTPPLRWQQGQWTLVRVRSGRIAAASGKLAAIVETVVTVSRVGDGVVAVVAGAVAVVAAREKARPTVTAVARVAVEAANTRSSRSARRDPASARASS